MQTAQCSTPPVKLQSCANGMQRAVRKLQFQELPPATSLQTATLCRKNIPLCHGNATREESRGRNCWRGNGRRELAGACFPSLSPNSKAMQNKSYCASNRDKIENAKVSPEVNPGWYCFPGDKGGNHNEPDRQKETTQRPAYDRRTPHSEILHLDFSRLRSIHRIIVCEVSCNTCF